MKFHSFFFAWLSLGLLVVMQNCTSKPAPDPAAASPVLDTLHKTPDSITHAFASVNGLHMYYELHGHGQPLVLLHGGGSTIASTFGRILPFLVQHHRVIAIELQAHGRTSDRNAPETFKQDAEDVNELLSQLKIDSADVLGFSNGGQTAMQLAMDHPARVRKLIIASAFYQRSGAPAALWKGMEHASFSAMPQPLKDEFLKVRNDSAALFNMFKKDSERMRLFKDWTDQDLQSIKSPALLLAGDKDVILSEHAVKMSRLIPRCQLAIVPGGHGKYLGEITTLENGKWSQEYIEPLIEDFLRN